MFGSGLAFMMSLLKAHMSTMPLLSQWPQILMLLGILESQMENTQKIAPWSGPLEMLGMMRGY